VDKATDAPLHFGVAAAILLHGFEVACFTAARKEAQSVAASRGIAGDCAGPLKELAAQCSQSEPAFVVPMKCKPVDAVPKGNWVVELKLDGFRALAIKNDRKVELLSRNHNDLSRRFPQVWEAVGRLRCRKLTLDGEIVALDEQGRPSFQSLQDINGRRAASRVFFYVFDVINCEGKDLTGLPLETRRMILAEGLAERPPIIRLSEHIGGPVARSDLRSGPQAATCGIRFSGECVKTSLHRRS